MTNETTTDSKRQPLTVLSFGGGQDSTALLYLYAFDANAELQEYKMSHGHCVKSKY